MDNDAAAFIAEYMKPLFYFSLKKTSDRASAEELTQEILYEAIKSLRRGNVPTEDPGAWIWRIARNRYSRWAAGKKTERENRTFSEPDGETPDYIDLSDGLILDEERCVLRRELALTRRDHREIVTAYYYENRSIAEIAASLSLPPGTIKRRLYECRKKLKEGMEMARKYGKRSFAPENISILTTWEKGENGSKYLERKIPVNICLEAYDNPSTAEELSLELGVAMPYMEEELDRLVSADLLVKEGGRYKTNFAIISRQAQHDLDKKLTEMAEKIAPLAVAAIDLLKDRKVFGGYQGFEELKWSLCVMLCDDVIHNAYKKITTAEFHWVTEHSDGSVWSLFGYEIADCSFITVEMCGTGNLAGQFIVPFAWGFEGRDTALSDGECDAISHMLKGCVEPSDTPVFGQLAERGIVRRVGGGYEPRFATVTLAERGELIGIYKSGGLYGEMAALAEEYQQYAVERIKKDIPPYLFEKTMWSTDADNLRGYVLKYGVDTGWLTPVIDIDKNAGIGMWLYL